MSNVEWREQVSEATKRFVDAVEGIDAAGFVAATSVDQGWSVAEVVEHVAVANGSILSVLSKRLEPLAGPPDVTDEEMPYLFYGGGKEPPGSLPTGAWTDVEDAVRRLDASASALGSWAAEAPFELRTHGARHAVFGTLDAAQWMRFSAVHTWRHRSQVIGVRRALGV